MKVLKCMISSIGRGGSGRLDLIPLLYSATAGHAIHSACSQQQSPRIGITDKFSVLLQLI